MSALGENLSLADSPFNSERHQLEVDLDASANLLTDYLGTFRTYPTIHNRIKLDDELLRYQTAWIKSR